MSEQPQWKGTISHMGIVDLTWAESEEDLAGITGFENIGVLRVAPKLYRYVISKPMRNVGVVEQSDPTRGPKQEITGQARLTGAYLASGDPETTLEIMGQLVVLPPLEAIGFKQVRVMGQMILPRGSEAILSAKLGSLHGNIIYYPADKGAPRLFMGKEQEAEGL